MDTFGIFDIIGPVMIGPSSSHTAGAVKLGNIAANIFGRDIKRVVFNLHGSFYKTHKGHGTDKALLAGIMGMMQDDDRLPNSFDLADKSGLKYKFCEKNLGDVHPNTVEMVLFDDNDNKISIIGSSIGAGNIRIIKIDDTDVEVDGNYDTLITQHNDKPGVIAKISQSLSTYSINIAFMKVFRSGRGEKATLIVQVDDDVPDELVRIISEYKEVYKCRFIRSLKG